MGDEQAVNWILGRGRSSGKARKAGKAGKDILCQYLKIYTRCLGGQSAKKTMGFLGHFLACQVSTVFVLDFGKVRWKKADKVLPLKPLMFLRCLREQD